MTPIIQSSIGIDAQVASAVILRNQGSFRDETARARELRKEHEPFLASPDTFKGDLGKLVFKDTCVRGPYRETWSR
jgi:hypothetical protein